MATVFLPRLQRMRYRVMVRKDGKWELWTNYPSYDDAALAAYGLAQKLDVEKSHVIELPTAWCAQRIVAEFARDDSGKVQSRKP